MKCLSKNLSSCFMYKYLISKSNYHVIRSSGKQNSFVRFVEALYYVINRNQTQTLNKIF